MKYLILLINLMLAANALALSCPNNGSVLNTGSLEEVLQRCGKPQQKLEYTKKFDVVEEWHYYRAAGNQNTKLAVAFTHDRVVNIHITDSASNEQNLTNTGLCGNFIGVGNSKAQVQAACGIPAAKVETQNRKVQVTELKYGGSEHNNTFIYEDGKFVELK